ncbi:MAG: DUF3604 domain-containing protein, partial [Deltaproteobacteria bacterium]|nr:DUF3604 domain-containing protein [Deltaproteobacteria bacterium]
MAKRTLIVLLAAGLIAVFLIRGASRGWFGSDETAGDVNPVARSEVQLATSQADQAATLAALGASPAKQVLFGDFHVHTTFSFDAFMMNLPMSGGGGSYPPSDACDFARYCSALDFWSINDHAESLTPR